MVCSDYEMGQCKPSWSKVGMEITPRDHSNIFVTKDNQSFAVILESGWGFTLFFLGLVSVIAVVVYLWIAKRMQKQVNGTTNEEKVKKTMGLQEKILVRIGKVEERIDALEEFVYRQRPRKSKAEMGDQKDSD